MSVPVIKVALIGVGRMGRNHLRVLEGDRDFQVVAALDPACQAGMPLEGRQIPCVGTPGELQKFDFECVIIAAPTASHLELIEYFLEQGKSVLVEKPVCATAAESQNLLEKIRQTGGRVYVGHVERFNPAVLKAEELLKSGVLGTPVHFAFTRVGGQPSELIAGTSVLIDLAIHDLDILRMLAGEMRVVAGVCQSTWRNGVYDTSEILLAGKKGVSASIHSNWISPAKIRNLRITGTGGVCMIDYMLQTCVLYGGDISGVTGDSIVYRDLVEAYQSVRRTEFSIARVEPLVNQLRALYLALTGQESRICTAEDAVKSVELAEHALSISEKYDFF